MDDSRKLRGSFAEGIAINFLKKKRFKIITANYQYRGGEIDIIAFDPRKKELVFVEVRSKWCDSLAKDWQTMPIIPEDSVNKTKFHKIEKTVWFFLEKETVSWQRYAGNLPRYSFPEWRIDLISVTIEKYTKTAQIRHYEYLFF
ncbi:MAG: YraN family protein [Candidatus Moranbacteria bacterium]|nr:YraN family protein [Candidatus Moranbacteria bacterium]